MNILTVTNLLPRPDEPQRGLYNYELFKAIAEDGNLVTNLCLVPEWHIWRWMHIRNWESPLYHLRHHSFSTTYLPVFYLPVIGRNWSWRSYSRSLAQFRRLADEADAILATWLYPDCVAAARALWDGKKPFFMKAHGSDRFHLVQRRGKLIKEVSENATALVTNSVFLKQEIVSSRIPEAKVKVIRHGVDSGVFCTRNRKAALAELGRGDLEEKSVILWAGNLKPEKRPGLMLEAFARLRSKNDRESELALVYLGTGPEEKDLKTQSRKLGIDKYLSFEGSVGRKQVALWMNAASCLCLTSRTESMPNVLLEAYSSGLPVAACNVGDVSFWLSDHPDAGLIVPSDKGECIKSLPRAIERLLEGEKHPSKAYTRTWQDVAGEIITLIRVKAEQQEK